MAWGAGRGVLGSHGRYITLNSLQAELAAPVPDAKPTTKKSAGKTQQPKPDADTSLFDKELERQVCVYTQKEEKQNTSRIPPRPKFPCSPARNPPLFLPRPSPCPPHAPPGDWATGGAA